MNNQLQKGQKSISFHVSDLSDDSISSINKTKFYKYLSQKGNVVSFTYDNNKIIEILSQAYLVEGNFGELSDQLADFQHEGLLPRLKFDNDKVTTSIDLSQLSIDFSNVTFQDCSIDSSALFSQKCFDEVTFKNVSFESHISGEMTSCNFQNCILKEYTTFENVNFGKVKFDHLSTEGHTFIEAIKDHFPLRLSQKKNETEEKFNDLLAFQMHSINYSVGIRDILFINCEFYDAIITNSQFNSVTFKATSLHIKKLKNTTFHNCLFENCTLFLTKNSTAKFNHCIFKNVKFVRYNKYKQTHSILNTDLEEGLLFDYCEFENTL